MEAIRKNITDSENDSVTENGAHGYRTSGKKLLDLNFSVSSLRERSEDEVRTAFIEAFDEDPVTAIKWLFYARDVRGGLGERRLFRIALTELAEREKELVRAVLPLVPEYGRWDDLWCLFDTPLSNDVFCMVEDQLNADMYNQLYGKSVSLLAKWMPSLNTSSKKTRALARRMAHSLGWSEKTYRTTLSCLRDRIKVVERDMSANRWGDIPYPSVPSRANLIYRDAFMRHDPERRTEYLNEVNGGRTSIHSGTLFPGDIVHKNGYKRDDSCEALWNALPNIIAKGEGTMVVADGSGSMTWCSTAGGMTPWEVAHALAIYFAERMTGEFKDRYITFSSHPRFVDLSSCGSLYDKLTEARKHSDCSNTDIEAVFRMILDTASANEMTQDDLPKNILIISDMEFDAPSQHFGAKLFDKIRKDYESHGYRIPRLIFWNVASRTGTIPVIENDLGVALVSGYSPNTAKMVMSGKLDPYECLLETLNSERYQPVEDAIRGLS